MLAKGIGTLTNLDPERELSTTLQQAVVATRQLLDVDAPGSCRPTATASCAGPAPLTSSPSHREQPGNPRAGPLNGRHTQPAAMDGSRRRERQWGEITLVLGATAGPLRIARAGELGGGPIGTLEVYTTTPPG